MYESREDFFEDNGRIGIISAAGGINPVLLVGHSTTFKGLGFRWADVLAGADLSLEFRIDAEGLVPILGTLEVKIPEDPNDVRWGGDFR
jgi:hypothetical protein